MMNSQNLDQRQILEEIGRLEACISRIGIPDTLHEKAQLQIFTRMRNHYRSLLVAAAYERRYPVG